MIYNIGNNPETAKLLQQTMPPNTKDFGSWQLLRKLLAKNFRWNSTSIMETMRMERC